VSWSFEFEDQPWFAGFRDLATNGVDKPVLNVFRMFGMMNGKRVRVDANRMYSLQNFVDSSVRGMPDIGAIAARDKNSAAIMYWNYHDKDTAFAVETVNISVNDIPAKKIKITEYRIDQTHSNSYELWKQMGSPQAPNAQQVALLEKKGKLELVEKPYAKKVDGAWQHRIMLPGQAVSLIKIEW